MPTPASSPPAKLPPGAAVAARPDSRAPVGADAYRTDGTYCKGQGGEPCCAPPAGRNPCVPFALRDARPIDAATSPGAPAPAPAPSCCFAFFC